jgi:hypothetical protein
MSDPALEHLAIKADRGRFLACVKADEDRLDVLARLALRPSASPNRQSVRPAPCVPFLYTDERDGIAGTYPLRSTGFLGSWVRELGLVVLPGSQAVAGEAGA